MFNTAPKGSTAAPPEQSQVYIVPLVRKGQVGLLLQSRRGVIVGNCPAEVEKVGLVLIRSGGVWERTELFPSPLVLAKYAAPCMRKQTRS